MIIDRFRFSLCNETFPIPNVVKHIFNLGTATIYLPLALAEEVRLRFIELFRSQITLLKLAITNNFSLVFGTAFCVLLTSFFELKWLFLNHVIASRDSLLRVQKWTLSADAIGAWGGRRSRLIAPVEECVLLMVYFNVLCVLKNFKFLLPTLGQAHSRVHNTCGRGSGLYLALTHERLAHWDRIPCICWMNAALFWYTIFLF